MTEKQIVAAAITSLLFLANEKELIDLKRPTAIKEDDKQSWRMQLLFKEEDLIVRFAEKYREIKSDMENLKEFYL